MEDLCQRFPHLAEGIFNSLDSQSFLNCLIASKSLVSSVEQQKFFQIRKITGKDLYQVIETLVESFYNVKYGSSIITSKDSQKISVMKT